MKYDDIIQIPPYSLEKKEKETLLTNRLLELTELHKKNCPEYSNILKSLDYQKENIKSYKDIPFLPVRLFKECTLKSVSDDEIVKTMTSSGTSGQKVSKIYLNRETSSNQQKTMVKIVSDFTGSSRMPMIIIDCPSVIKDRNMFSARGAGILGFSIFGAKKIYALNDDMSLNLEELRSFIDLNKDKKILLFGFTFMIWQHFYKELLSLKEKTGESFDLSNAILIHGGGWKKLINEAVSPEVFHASLKAVCGIDRVHDYYGMVEQTGCIYMQCECGHLHSSIFSDVIIRNPRDFKEAAIGERGIIQVVSAIPESYPGHSLLTEDEGQILGEDDCPCGRKGKYFKIFGRLKNAEIRGCSDTYAQDHSIKQICLGQEKELEIFNNLQFFVGNEKTLKSGTSLPPMKAFDEKIIDFCNEISKKIMSSPEARVFPDVVTLGFWLRKANISKLKNKYLFDESLKIGKGVAFHIAPSNVPINYAYSLFTGILCGNINIVRIPSKDFPQIIILNKIINAVLEKYPEFAGYINLIRYERSTEVNDYLSNLCDVRIVWGGDSTIAELRKSRLKPRSTEVTFADRFSLSIIDSDFYLELENKEKIAQDFYNDTYLSDQNACTSPRIIVWLGKNSVRAKELFWEKVYQLVKEKYFYQPIMGVDKLSLSYLIATKTEVKNCPRKDNLLYRIQLDKIPDYLMDYKGNSGYFYEYDTEDILSVRALCDDTHCQTVGMIGDSNLIKPLFDAGIKGIDRVVPVGHTMDFDLLWDGYNLIDRFTRSVVIK